MLLNLGSLNSIASVHNGRVSKKTTTTYYSLKCTKLEHFLLYRLGYGKDLQSGSCGYLGVRLCGGSYSVTSVFDSIALFLQLIWNYIVYVKSQQKSKVKSWFG